MKRTKRGKNTKKRAQPSLSVELFQPDPGTKRWISYSLPELKIEVMYIEKEKVWIAAGTLNDESSYYSGELFESASERVVALTALLSQTGLPMMLGIVKDFNSNIYSIYPQIEFKWQDASTGRFDSEPILPKRDKLDITFYQRSDGSWIWQNRFCMIEVMLIDSTWIATSDPRSSGFETTQRPRLTYDSNDRDNAVELLLKDSNIAAILGLCYGQQIPLSEFFDVVRVEWRVQTKRITSNKKAKPPEQSGRNRCSWASIAKQCDGTFNCSFCASYGDAYFIRWDD